MEVLRLLAQLAISCAVMFMWWHMQTVVLSSIEIPAGNRDLVMRMAGMLDAAVIFVLGFWLGTSLSSARKDDKTRPPKPAKETPSA